MTPKQPSRSPDSWRGFFCAFLTLSALLGGCQRRISIPDPPKYASISGTVTSKGAPLAKGSITFVSYEAKSSFRRGTQIENGKFSLPPEESLPPGKYEAMISVDGEAPNNQAERRFPAEIKEGTPPVFTFTLE